MVTGRKLLLADDSVTIQKVVDLTFTDEGLEVLTVGDGQQALDKLAEFMPDIVLADVFMPKVNGYELCAHVKHDERFRHIPVMLLVGSFEPFDEAEARRVGADDYLTKPFQSIRTLIGKVRNLLSGGGHSDLDKATTRQLAPPPEVERVKHPDSDFLELTTADTAPLPDADQEDERAGVATKIPFADLSMDDEMIEATPAGDYGHTGPLASTRLTAQYSAADLQDAGITPAAETAPTQHDSATSSTPASEPAHSEPANIEPALIEPAHSELTHSEPEQVEPSASEPAHSEHAHSEPLHAEPTHAELVQTESVQAEPAHSEPARVESAHVEPAHAATGHTQATAHASGIAASDDALLDLGEIEPRPAAHVEADDFFLDLLDEGAPQAHANAPSMAEAAAAPAAAAQHTSTATAEHAEFAPVEVEAPPIASDESGQHIVPSQTQRDSAASAQAAPTQRLPADFQPYGTAGAASATASNETSATAHQPPRAGQITLEQLAPEVIETIARRVVEQLSASAVEQIAWEVVPQLAELLIKRRLEEKQ